MVIQAKQKSIPVRGVPTTTPPPPTHTHTTLTPTHPCSSTFWGLGNPGPEGVLSCFGFHTRGCLPTCSSATFDRDPPRPPPPTWTDKHDWKHYLPSYYVRGLWKLEKKKNSWIWKIWAWWDYKISDVMKCGRCIPLKRKRSWEYCCYWIWNGWSIYKMAPSNIPIL